MKKHLLLLSPAILFCLLMQSCNKQNTTAPAAAPTGTIAGYVDLYDEYGNIMSSSKGVRAKLSHNSNSALTDANGKYAIPGLPFQYYNILFTKTGYGTAENQGVQLLAEDTLYIAAHAKMSQIPDFSVTSISLSVNKAGDLVIKGTVDKSDTRVRKVFFFMNDSSNVSSDASGYKIFASANVNPDSLNFSFSITPASLNSSGFASGSTVYIASYGGTYITGASTVFNPAYGRLTYNAVSAGSPATGSIKLP